MEILFELLWVVVEFVGELLLQLLLEVLAEAGVRLFRSPHKQRPPVSAWLAALGYIALGAAAGGISLWLFPNLFIQNHAGRIASLLLMPVASGAAMAALGAWRQRARARPGRPGQVCLRFPVRAGHVQRAFHLGPLTMKKGRLSRGLCR